MKRTIFFTLFLLIPCLFVAQTQFAQETGKDAQDMTELLSEFTLKDLLNVSIVTVSKKEETVFDAPLAASVLTGDEIRKSGATSIMEALRLVPGMIVREQTPGNYDIHIRGLDAIDPYATFANSFNSITLVMINNRIVYNDAQGGTFWEVLQLGIDDVDRIEVVRGPAAALYGPNAASGVINILTKKPNARKGLYGSSFSQGGNFGTAILNGAIGYGGEKWSLRVSGLFETRNRHQVDYYRFRRGDTLNNANILAEGGYFSRPEFFSNETRNPRYPIGYPNESRSLERLSGNAHLQYTAEGIDLNVLGGYAEATPQRIFYGFSSYPVNVEENQFKFLQAFGKVKDFSFTTDLNAGNNTIIAAVSYDFTVFNFSGDYDFKLADNFNIKPGVAYRYIFFTSPPQAQATFEDSQNYIASPFIRAEYLIGRFRFIGGLRWDKFRVPDASFLSPQAIITYKPNDNLIFRASYGRSARTPFITNIFGNIPETNQLPYRIQANDDAKLFTADSFEGGVKYNLSEKISLDIEGFYTAANNFEALTFQQLVGSEALGRIVPLFKFQNTSQKAQQFGGTFTITAVPASNFRLQGFITLQQTNVDDYNYLNPTSAQATFGQGRGQSVVDSSFTHGATPTFFGGITANYEPTSKLNLNLNAYYYGEQQFSVTSSEPIDAQSLNTVVIKPNVILNATITLKTGNSLKVFASGRNLIGAERQFGFADSIDRMFLFGIIAAL